MKTILAKEAYFGVPSDHCREYSNGKVKHIGKKIGIVMKASSCDHRR